MNTCCGFTAKGDRCRRRIKAKDLYCHSHKGQDHYKDQVVVVPVSVALNDDDSDDNQLTCEFVCCMKSVARGRHVCKDHLPVLNKLEKPEECPICVEPMTDVRVPLSCGHWVHRECQLKHKDTCCMCRQPIVLTATEKQKLSVIVDQRRDELMREQLLGYQRMERQYQRQIAQQMARIRRFYRGY